MEKSQFLFLRRQCLYGAKIVVSVILAASLAACARTSGNGNPPAGVASAIKTQVGPSLVYTPGKWWKLGNDGYHLVELLISPANVERIYVWVDKANKVTMASTFASAPVYEKFENGYAYFRCTMVADTLRTFPYYLAGMPGEEATRESFVFMVPDKSTFSMSSAGLAYELSGTSLDKNIIKLTFEITGGAKGGAVSGGMRPPKVRVSESGSRVTLTFSDVVSGEGSRQALQKMSASYGKVESASQDGDSLVVVLGVSGMYSLKIAPGDSSSNGTFGSAAVDVALAPRK